MCGRFTLFTDKEQRELYKIIKEVDEKLKRESMSERQIKIGEIYPTNLVPVLMAENESISAEAAAWGFPNFKNKGVIINARAETAPEKKMFAKPLQSMRCVVPSTGFYEWDKRKTKYLFNEPGQDLLYMAGIVNLYQDERRFVILTTNANESMQEIHNRMPVILEQEEIGKYLWDYQFALSVLNRVPVQLVRKGEVQGEQMQFDVF